jgi:hypothetical protein
MGLASDCYNPKTFKPGNNPLLSVGQWQMLQLYLVDAMNLPLTSADMPYPDVLAIYKKLHTEAVDFHGSTLGQALSMGNKLYSYGQTASRTFRGVVQLMDQPAPNKEAILQLLGNLQQTAATYQTGANGIFNAIESYISATQAEARDLSAAVKRETDKIMTERSQIQILQGRYNALYADKQQAQATIVNDENTINETKYYAWIPFVGTAVAVGEIIAKRNDIQQQLIRINNDIAEMQRIQGEIQRVDKEVAHLTYTAQYNAHMIEEINGAMQGTQLIESAWKTIANELGDVVGNIKMAAAQELKNQACLASVALSAAADEWQDVANDAQSFTLNFYLAPKMAA